jgi:hypothetical protein
MIMINIILFDQLSLYDDITEIPKIKEYMKDYYNKNYLLNLNHGGITD